MKRCQRLKKLWRLETLQKNKQMKGKFLLLKHFFAVIILLQITIFAQAQRKFVSSKLVNNQIDIVVSDGVYKIQPFSNKIIRTSFYPSNKKLSNLSFAVESKAKKQNIITNENDNFISYTMDSLEVKIQKQPFCISYLYKTKLLIKQNIQLSQPDTVDMMHFKIEQNEVLYGGGERVLGMNRRGNRLRLYNRAHYGYTTHSELMNYSLPLFISSKKYAVLFDNVSDGFLDLDSKKNNTINYWASAGVQNYYVVVGNNWYDLVNEYTNLTGKQPLPPRWAFGNFSSRFGYHSQAETEYTINKYFENNIPVDAVILDIYWFGKTIKGTMGNLEWETDSFPNPNKMIKDFAKKGVNTILITEPFILTTSKTWKEADNKHLLALNSGGKPYRYNFYFGNTGLIDIFKPSARRWFWNIYKKYINEGIGGWWGDLGEPEVHPDDIIHVNGKGSDIHNAYGHEWAKMIFDGYKTDFPNQRPFILMRSGYAGSQRYGIIPWTGDVSRSWGGLQPQPEISLLMGMQGIAYMHSDLGGFAGGDSIDNELYGRWLQYGVFQPIFRPHAQEHIAPEPVFQINSTMALARQAINLRYKLKPYIYNIAFENSVSGKPLMRPLFFNEPDNKDLQTYDSAYMWGDAFLVSPIKERGKKTQSVYLPKGSNWTNFFTGKVYEGGKTYDIDLSIKNIPVFVKGGSFIAMKEEVANEKSYSLDKYTLHYYADNLHEKSDYTLYNDDGKTPDAYAKGEYELSKFIAINKKGQISLSIKKDYGSNYKFLNDNIVTIKIHNIKKPKKVKINNVKLSKNKWNWKNNILTFEVKCSKELLKIQIIP